MMAKKYLLILDCEQTQPQSTEMTIAVANEQKLVVRRKVNLKKNGANELLLKLVEAMELAKIKWGQVSTVALRQGAGHFTTSRLCAVTANMIGWSLRRPLVNLDANTPLRTALPNLWSRSNKAANKKTPFRPIVSQYHQKQIVEPYKTK